MSSLRSAVRRAGESEALRLILLTLYYLAIIVALIVLYGGATYTPAPFVYQGF